MLNYKKTLVVVAYHRNFEGLIKLHAEEPVVSHVRPVAHTPIVAAIFTLPIFIVTHFLCS